jgi:hypothetical protein
MLRKAKELAFLFAEAGYTLRSGGADGADTAFERGFHEKGGKTEIYLPWKGFNKDSVEREGLPSSPLYRVPDTALELASTIHPAWSRCSSGAKLLHGRNCQQVLGQDLECPTDLVVCWTLNGKDSGGTRTAIVLAKSRDIPIINLGSPIFNLPIEDLFSVAKNSLKKMIDDIR